MLCSTKQKLQNIYYSNKAIDQVTIFDGAFLFFWSTSVRCILPSIPRFRGRPLSFGSSMSDAHHFLLAIDKDPLEATKVAQDVARRKETLSDTC